MDADVYQKMELVAQTQHIANMQKQVHLHIANIQKQVHLTHKINTHISTHAHIHNRTGTTPGRHRFLFFHFFLFALLHTPNPCCLQCCDVLVHVSFHHTLGVYPISPTKNRLERPY